MVREDLGRCIFFLGRNGWCIDIVDVLMICLRFVGFQPRFASPCSKDVNFTTFSTDTFSGELRSEDPGSIRV